MRELSSNAQSFADSDKLTTERFSEELIDRVNETVEFIDNIDDLGVDI